MDTETNWTDSWAERFLVGIAIATADREFYIPVDSPQLLGTSFFQETFKGPLPENLFNGHKIIMHNAKFDVSILQRNGLKIDTSNVEDTMMMAHFIDENPPHGLKELAISRLGYVEPKSRLKGVRVLSKTGGGYEHVPTPIMAGYAMQDARMTYDLFFKLQPEFAVYRELWESVDRPFLFALMHAEDKGLLFDRHLASQRSAETDKQLMEIVSQLGFDPAKPKLLARALFADPPFGLGLDESSFPKSPKTGRPTLNDDALKSVGLPLTSMVRLYRSYVKYNSAYYRAYLDLSRLDDRLHATFKPWGTVNGRLSCENPNLQQIPRDDTDDVDRAEYRKIKELFLPEDNSELWEFDFKNIELRLAAVYAGNAELLEAFRNDKDIHQEVATKLGIRRHEAKTLNFAIIYGAGVNKIKEQLHYKHRSQAEIVINSMQKAYPEIFMKMDQAAEQAEIQNWIRIWSGRRRHFKYPSETHKAFNSVVQGGSFEIVKQGMLNVVNQGYDVRNNVHDSLWINIPKNDVSDALAEIPKLMSDWTSEAFGLRFTVDSKRLN